MNSNDNTRALLVGIVGAVCSFFIFRGGSGGSAGAGSSGKDPLTALPRDAFMAMTVDATELRQSPIFDALLAGTGPTKGPKDTGNLARALGIGTLADGCGFDPLARVKRLAVAIPEDGERGEFGLAASVDVTSAELERCTKALLDKRGGKAETREVGSFNVLEEGGPRRPRLAYGKGGLLVVGKGTWFDAMLGAADGKAPGLSTAPEHAALRTSLTSKEGFRTPTVLVTAVLPKPLRERLKREMGAELGAEDGTSAAMGGVLGVSSVGLAVRAGAAGQRVDAAAELVCDSADACGAVESFLGKKRLAWGKDLALRVVGFGPLVDTLEIERKGSKVLLRASVASEVLASAIDRAMRWGGGEGDAAPRRKPENVPMPHPPGKPDEKLVAPSTAVPAPTPAASR